MKRLFLVTALLPTFANAQSISDLPSLSKMIIHHFDCRVAILPARGPNKELKFQIDPSAGGHGGPEVTVTLGDDKVVASANSEMLEVDWSRSGQTVAHAQAWVQSSSTRSHVVILADPKDESSQVHLNCDAVTYDQLKSVAQEASAQ